MKKIIIICARIVLSVLIISGSIAFYPQPAQAWEQGASGTHEEINRQAAARFFNSMSNNSKFEKSPIDKTKTYLAARITSSSLAQSGLTLSQSSMNFEEWVAHGGYSADEPHLWASVRHFYDPLSVNGVPQLTDHNWVHGALYDAISARQWAFEDSSNPYTWRKALEYYKKAMEITEDSKITVVPGTGFRDPDISVNSNEQARNVYLGKAFRALGETMHMMADLTQPAHVRNDSHPNGDTDPIESTANRNTVLLVKDKPVDPEAEKDISAAASALDMYEKLALYTNRNFYTDDTIYDKASGVSPRNSEKPYPHPQFSDLKEDKSQKQKTYVKQFNGKDVRMVQQTYTSWKLGTSVWQDYQVPPSFVAEQAEVLMPIAIRANMKLINSFFPTMDLVIEVKENTNKNIANYKEFSIASPFKHTSGSDADWSKSGLTIQYSGPGELWVKSGSSTKKLGNLIYKQGALEKPVAVFVGDSSNAKTDLYQVKDKDVIYAVVNAGGRNFKSNEYTISAQTDLTILPPEVTLAPNAKQTFTVKMSGAGRRQVTWTIDEGAAGGDMNSAFGIYTAPAKTGTYHVTATLNSDRSKKATAVVTVSAVTVAIKPPAATVATKGTQTFTAEVTGNPEKRVTWKVDDAGSGTITADGVYTAPDVPGTYRVTATARADSAAIARATVTVNKVAVNSGITITLNPKELILVPSQKAEIRATVTGTNDTRVYWVIPNEQNKTQSGDIPVTFSHYAVGEYTIMAASAADNTKRAEIKVKVVPGVWTFVSKTEKSFPNIGLGMPPSTGGVTLSAGSAAATNQTDKTLSKWTFTWTVPPLTLPVGQKFSGTYAVKDAGTVYDAKVAVFPMGSGGVYMQMDSSVGECLMMGVGRQMQVSGFPFTGSASKNFSLAVPASRVGGPQLNIRVDTVADVNFGGSSWTQQRGEVLYKYELRPQ